MIKKDKTNKETRKRRQSMSGIERRTIRRRCSQTAAINDILLDELLIEILSRVESAKSATICKSVCKRWLSLISSPYFIGRFVDNHRHYRANNSYCHVDDQNRTQKYYYNSHALGSRRLQDIKHYEHTDDFYENPYFFLAISEDPIFQSPGFQLNFLPDEKDSIKVVASSNDLLLCRVVKNVKPDTVTFQYYVCNPFTMQWTAIAPFLTTRMPSGWTRVGFICEPYYYNNNNALSNTGSSSGSAVINDKYQFRIVHIIIPDGGYVFVETYRSETECWSKMKLCREQYAFAYPNQMVAHNGKLHWYSRRSIVAYDPFTANLSSDHHDKQQPQQQQQQQQQDQGEECFRLIDCPAEFIEEHHRFSNSSLQDHYCLGVCGGYLRMMKLVVGPSVESAPERTSLTVWKLEEEEEDHGITGSKKQRWILEHKVPFLTLIRRNPRLRCHFPFPITVGVQVIGCHPSDRFLVYLEQFGVIMLCNLRTLKLKVVHQIPCRYTWSYEPYFIVANPWWPTPIND